jgi:ATP-binding cassette subfamily B protein
MRSRKRQKTDGSCPRVPGVSTLSLDLKEQVKGLLKKHVLFSLLGDEAIAHLVRGIEVVSLSLGETILHEGEPGDCAYLIKTGRVRVFKKTDDGRMLTLGALGPGDLFGEQAVLRNEVRNASVRVSEDVTLFRIRQVDFLALLKAQPALAHSIETLIKKRSLISFLLLETPLRAVPPRQLVDLVEHIKEECFEEGETILRQGEAADRFYVVRSGEVRVSRQKPGAATELAGHLGPGESFGEQSLLEGRPCDATYTAASATHCCVLESGPFEKLLADVPELRAALQQRVGTGEGAAPVAPVSPVAGARPVEVEEPRQHLQRRRGWWQKYPWLPQHDQTDCGAACLAMAGRYHGIRLSVGQLRETANVGREGCKMLSLALAAESVGFNARAVRTDYGHLANLNLPAIAHWKGNHYVVVYEARDDKVVVGDPAVGVLTLGRAEFEAGWAGRLLLLTATPRLESQEPRRNTLQRFLPFLTPFRLLLFEVLLASLLLEVLRLASPIFTQVVVDRVLVHQNVNMLNVMLVGMLFVGTFQIAATFLRQYLLQNIGQRLGLLLSADLFRQVLRLPMRFFHSRKVGDFLVRFQDNQRIKEMLTGRAITTLLDMLMIVTSVSLMMYYSVRLTLVALVAFPLYIGLALAFTPRLRRANRLTFEKKTQAESTLVEAIKSIGALKDACAEVPTRWKYEDLVVQQTNMEHRSRHISLLLEGLFRSVQILAALFLLWYGAHLVIRRELTVGQLMAFNALVAMLAVPILGMVQLRFDLQTLELSLERLNDLYDAPAEQDTQRSALPLPRLKGHIRFDNVSFRYSPEDRNILCNINLEVRPGQRVALVGRSGAGKTTLAMLLQRFYLPTEGKITVDGFDISAVDVRSLREQVGVVAQESTIFSGTIRENIALAVPDAPLEKVIEAARQADAHDFSMSFPMGYDTVVGERGVRLSGGQRQRVAIARALLKAPRLLILDEATGALDYESERAIQQHLQRLMHDRTTLIIAHRLSTVQGADLIVVLDNGQVVEQGTHVELQARRGLYYYLTTQQIGS